MYEHIAYVTGHACNIDGVIGVIACSGPGGPWFMTETRDPVFCRLHPILSAPIVRESGFELNCGFVSNATAVFTVDLRLTDRDESMLKMVAL